MTLLTAIAIILFAAACFWAGWDLRDGQAKFDAYFDRMDRVIEYLKRKQS